VIIIINSTSSKRSSTRKRRGKTTQKNNHNTATTKTTTTTTSLNDSQVVQQRWCHVVRRVLQTGQQQIDGILVSVPQLKPSSLGSGKEAETVKSSIEHVEKRFQCNKMLQ
jgi:hypothetical protein